MTTSSTPFVPVKELWDGGTGVPVVIYKLCHQGVPLRTARKAKEAIEWLSHPYHNSVDHAIYSLIDGVERLIARGTGPRR